jgi:small subunit ribosomal protein S8
MARHEEVGIPNSRMKSSIAEALLREGYIDAYEVVPDGKQGILKIKLKYAREKPVIEGLERISKPSRRVYVSHTEIPKVRNGLGNSILSTPKGVMSDKEARKQRVGGELLCAVW